MPELRSLFAALTELHAAFDIEADVETRDGLARGVRAGPIALLVLDTDKLLREAPQGIAGLVGALKTASGRRGLRVTFRARELPLKTEAILAETAA